MLFPFHWTSNSHDDPADLALTTLSGCATALPRTIGGNGVASVGGVPSNFLRKTTWIHCGFELLVAAEVDMLLLQSFPRSHMAHNTWDSACFALLDGLLMPYDD
jgi:uncharacterized protein YceK